MLVDERTAVPVADLFRQGTPIVLAGKPPLVLNGSTRCWLVTAGQVDLFAVQARDGSQSGARRHVLRAQAGQAIFGIPGMTGQDQMIILLLRGRAGTTLLELSQQELRAAAQAAGELRQIRTARALDRRLRRQYSRRITAGCLPDSRARS